MERLGYKVSEVRAMLTAVIMQVVLNKYDIHKAITVSVARL